jgi:hypothetical protein
LALQNQAWVEGFCSFCFNFAIEQSFYQYLLELVELNLAVLVLDSKILSRYSASFLIKPHIQWLLQLLALILALPHFLA